MTMAAMPSMPKKSQGIRDFINAYTAEFLKAFLFDASSFQSLLGFSVVYIMIYTMLMGSIFSISITARILHRELGERIGEFLLVRPFTRAAFIASKLVMAWLTLLVGMNLLLDAVGVLVFALGRRA